MLLENQNLFFLLEIYEMYAGIIISDKTISIIFIKTSL